MPGRKIKAEGQVTHHGLLATGAQVCLQEYKDRVENRPDGTFYFLLASLMFSAFRVEATINVVGWKLLGDGWPERLSWKQKVKLIYSWSGQAIDFGSQPLQTIMKLFELRDKWAHPQPIQFSGEYKYDPFSVQDSRDPFKPEMQTRITLEFVEQCAAATDKFFENLLEVSGVEYFETMTHGMETGVFG